MKNKISKSVFYTIVVSCALFSCTSNVDIEENEASINSNIEEGLHHTAPDFPIGNVWSSGHPTWGTTKGTDLGGASDDFTATGFGVFSTIKHKQLDLSKEHEILNTQFNRITPEVALKMHNISVGPDSIDFTEADAMMDFAEANNMKVHGHVILFDRSIPNWAKEYARNNVWTEQQWENWLENYINTVVGRYRGRIESWDVLNEIAFEFGGGLKTSEFLWYDVIGPDYVEKTFKWVEQADPNAKLFINDNNQELIASKNSDIINYADELRALGCKVDGIGFQSHIIVPLIQGDYPDAKRAYKRAADAGYLVMISELDVVVNLLGATHSQTQFQHRLQRLTYNNIARAYNDGVPPAQRWGISLWNISDQNSFFNILKIFNDLKIFGGKNDYPLIYDNNYNPKPAYFGLRNGLRGNKEGWFYPLLSSTERTTSSYDYVDSKREFKAILSSKEMVDHIKETRYYLKSFMQLPEEEIETLIEDGISKIEGQE